MRYGNNVLSGDHWRGERRPVATVEARLGIVVEEPLSGFCGAVVGCERDHVTLEDRRGRHRVFPLRPAGFLIDGAPVTLVRPVAAKAAPTLSASGSLLGDDSAKVARASRIYVEGLHDAALVERVWGHDLRVEGVVVECLDGADHLESIVAEFGPGPNRRLGILLDHLVDGSKETKIAQAVSSEFVLVCGHPFVDVWQAVKPDRIGIERWPDVPRGRPWKEGVIEALGWNCSPADAWRRILAAVDDYTALDAQLLGRVEELIDFVTAPGSQ